jgi:hypothetical protein
VAGSNRTWTEIERLLRRATKELERSARASAIATRHERLGNRASVATQTRSLHGRMAEIHHQLGQRHLTAAKIHRAHAERLRILLRSGAEGIPSAFMAAIAETSGADSAMLSLFGHQQAEALVVTSDPIAEAAHDLEAALAEGPGRDAAAGAYLVTAADNALQERWPLYGPAAARLGIRAAAAVPLGTPGRCLGILAVFGLRAGHHDDAASLGAVADAVTHTMLLGRDAVTGAETGARAGADEFIRLALPSAGDHLAVVHQAAGMLAGECGCGVGDSLAIIRARAFAEGESVEEIAARVVRRELHLCPDLPVSPPPADN